MPWCNSYWAKNALTKQYHKMFDMEGVEIDFREDGLRAVAAKAMERKTVPEASAPSWRTSYSSLCITFRLKRAWQK